MASCQRNDLFATASEEWFTSDKDRAHSLLDEGGEGHVSIWLSVLAFMTWS